MGFYINPTDGRTPEQWLANEGVLITDQIAKKFNSWKHGNHLPVCLVDNGDFKAAGIAVDEQLRDTMLRDTGRPTVWFLVERHKLQPWLPPDPH